MLKRLACLQFTALSLLCQIVKKSVLPHLLYAPFIYATWNKAARDYPELVVPIHTSWTRSTVVFNIIGIMAFSLHALLLRATRLVLGRGDRESSCHREILYPIILGLSG